MSYSIKTIGKKADVIAVANSPQSNLPDAVKNFIVQSIQAIPDPTIPPAPPAPWEGADSVYVEAQGHEPGSHNIKIERFNAAVPPPPTPAPQPTAATPATPTPEPTPATATPPPPAPPAPTQ